MLCFHIYTLKTLSLKKINKDKMFDDVTDYVYCNFLDSQVAIMQSEIKKFLKSLPVVILSK